MKQHEKTADGEGVTSRIGLDDLQKLALSPDMRDKIKDLLANMKPVTCEDYGHSWHHTGFGGGMSHWRCNRCGTCEIKPDFPVSI